MARTWTRRLVLLSASTALVAGGASVSSSAFAAPAAPHPGNVTTSAVSADGGSTVRHGYRQVVGPRDRSHRRMTYRWGMARSWW
ncbi:hypothetical protein PV721_10030 [Streptomyces sp. MB09-01]|uniref:hypothetical protein n=1 Tax=Streptomyces sp. MB09-01 TaxID=3028666 RepID=UPI0029BD883D|nr:hypothetical protein [Streptomyces sp. MB09-01]MDX3534700.1 hypothetical protein [Streptomyces sp. MB09-01]